MGKSKAQIKEELRRAAKRTSDRNYRFRKMAPNKQRVAIAKDVIEYLDTDRIVASPGSYLTVDYDDDAYDDIYNLCNAITYDSIWDSKEDVSAGKKAEKTRVDSLLSNARCEVCGIGGVFYAAVLRANKITLGDMEGDVNADGKMREYLGEWFSSMQLGMIEAAFEVSTAHARSAGVSEYQVSTAKNFVAHMDDPADRLRAIMNNIIDNDGVFVPSPVHA